MDAGLLIATGIGLALGMVFVCLTYLLEEHMDGKK